MGGINVIRWLLGGIVAGIVIWVFEGLGSLFYMGDMEAALAAHNLSMELSAGVWVMTIVVSMIVGLTLVFLYAAARPRFGPGPKTATLVAVVLWIASYLLSLIGYGMIGLYPTSMLALWGVVGLIEIIVAAHVGGWIYREGEQPVSG
ncbi:MAG: hypothetical protein JSW51_10320 [Gemmatimonadota bacterium]|nr:MAG: hypothetical protein JSW51_10320 [Gemmatimonadota bacterium]